MQISCFGCGLRAICVYGLVVSVMVSCWWGVLYLMWFVGVLCIAWVV